jgi:hypothetical protein
MPEDHYQTRRLSQDVGVPNVNVLRDLVRIVPASPEEIRHDSGFARYFRRPRSRDGSEHSREGTYRVDAPMKQHQPELPVHRELVTCVTGGL